MVGIAYFSPTYSHPPTQSPEHLLRLREEVQWLQSALAKERQRNERLWELLQAQLQERQETCQEERQREVRDLLHEMRVLI